MEREDTEENGEGSQQRETRQFGCSCRMQAESRRRKVEDDDVMPFHSNIDLPAQVEEERGLVGRGDSWVEARSRLLGLALLCYWVRTLFIKMG